MFWLLLIENEGTDENGFLSSFLLKTDELTFVSQVPKTSDVSGTTLCRHTTH